MAADDLWILGIHMTKFGKHPEMDLVDLASEAVLGALAKLAPANSSRLAAGVSRRR